MSSTLKAGSGAGLSRVRLFLAAISLAAAAAVPAQDPISVADFELPPQDAAGWTMLQPAADSRLIYIDADNGNDDTAAFHSPSDPEIGANPQAPSGSVQAFRTLAAATAQLREDAPDWLLLRAGRVWDESLTLRRGRSASERAVATTYGNGARPLLRTGTAKGITNVQLVNVAVVGIHFWAHTRDSDGPHFSGYEGSNGIGLYTRAADDPRQVRDVLIEDCFFRSYTNNVLTGKSTNGAMPITRFVMRRNIVSKNYNPEAHAQGLYHVGSGQPVQPSILLQENLFDHNGWRIQSDAGGGSDGQATIFNHNTYFTSANGVIFQRNLFLRASSIGTKWTATDTSPSRGLVIDDNLLAEGEVGISIGGNDPYGPLRFRDVSLRNNVVTDIGRTRPTNRSLAWSIELQDWQGGEMTNNLLAHQRTSIGNTWALKVLAEYEAEDVRISGNVIANMFTDSSFGLVRLEFGENVSNVLFDSNTVQGVSNRPVIAVSGGGYGFAGDNRYFTNTPGNIFRVNSDVLDLAGWIAETGDSGATVADPAFPDPSRTLEAYAQHLGLGDSFDDLLDALYGQSRNNWNPALTAGAINEWMRAGFGMAAEQPGDMFSDGFESS